MDVIFNCENAPNSISAQMHLECAQRSIRLPNWIWGPLHGRKSINQSINQSVSLIATWHPHFIQHGYGKKAIWKLSKTADGRILAKSDVNRFLLYSIYLHCGTAGRNRSFDQRLHKSPDINFIVGVGGWQVVATKHRVWSGRRTARMHTWPCYNTKRDSRSHHVYTGVVTEYRLVPSYSCL